MKFVIVKDSGNAVFLQCVMGVPVWSDGPCPGMDKAMAFDSRVDAQSFIRDHLGGCDDLDVYDVFIGEYADAHVFDCVDVGIREWHPWDSGPNAIKRNMVAVLDCIESIVDKISAMEDTSLDVASDWAERIGTMLMSTAYAMGEMGRAIDCKAKGDHYEGHARAAAASVRLHRAVATIFDDKWKEWINGRPPTSPLVTVDRSNGAANDTVRPFNDDNGAD